MCWSLEASVVGAFLIITGVVVLLVRGRRRDVGFSLFLAVFGSMQLVDVLLWLEVAPGHPACSIFNTKITKLAFGIIMAEPASALFGRAIAMAEWPSLREMVVYFVTFVILPLAPWMIPGDCPWRACTYVSDEGHLLYGRSPPETTPCWRQFYFVGAPVADVPFVLRVAFLLGILYPFLTMKPFAVGLPHVVVVTGAWVLGAFSDAHPSVWCAANALQSIVMIADPYLFKQRRPHVFKRNITEQRYRTKKVPKDLDAIVIGSGIGGLTTAALLSRAGRKVLVLERHYRAGGCTHAFDELGVPFDSGIHYVGSKKEMDTFLKYITSFPVHMAPMGSEKDGFVYDQFELGQRKGMVTYRRGYDEFEKELLEQWPEEKEGIQAFMQRMRQAKISLRALAVYKLSPLWLRKWIRPWVYRLLERDGKATAKEAVDQCVKDPALRALLSGGQIIDWNLEPDRVSFFVTSAMKRYYACDGGFYPAGGSKVIAEAIIPVIEEAGGAVLCDAEVHSLATEDQTGAVTGVHLSNGDFIPCSLVISAVGAFGTWMKIVPEEVSERCGIRPEALKVLEPSHPHVCAFITLNGTAEELGLTAANIHSMPELEKYDHDISKMQRAFYADPFCQKEPLMTLTCPSVKDPLWKDKYPDKSAVMLLVEGRMEWFSEFEEEPYGKRSDEYKALKAKFEPMFKERLFKHFPKAQGRVEQVELSTPMSSAHFLGTPAGASYGLEWTPTHILALAGNDDLAKMLDPNTPIPGLWQTGESAFVGGFVPAMTAGYMTAARVLGLPRFMWTLLSTEGPSEEKGK